MIILNENENEIKLLNLRILFVTIITKKNHYKFDCFHQQKIIINVVKIEKNKQTNFVNVS